MFDTLFRRRTTVQTENLVQERVTAGVAVLDRRIPGWHRRINLQDLNMASGVSCVLGQLFGDYAVGLNVIGVPGQGREHGFSISRYDDDGITYGDLDNEWARVIRLRNMNIAKVIEQAVETEPAKELVSA